MSVNKYVVRLKDFENDNQIKIPLSLDFNSVDQAEVVNRDFISVEVEKAINPIIDYDKVRFSPTKMDGSLVNDLTFKLNFLNVSGVYPSITYYSDIGFSDDDIKFRKNKFKNSFLRLSFYDSDVPTNQNLVSQITIFSKLTITDINPLVDNLGNTLTGGGLPKNANEIPVKQILNNPITTPRGFAEGFYVYHFKSDLEVSNPSTLYMRAEFNNAANGKITKFIATDELLSINSVIKKLHTKYLLKRDATGYFYSLDNTYNDSTNITESGTGVTLNLFEIRAE
jgi:hypothetical protein